MSSVIKKIISDALDEAIEEGSIKTKKPVIVERPKKEGFGDFSTNIAMLLSPGEFQPARKLAAILIPKIEASPVVSGCEAAGPGFINIFLEKSYWHALLKEMLKKGADYGNTDTGAGEKVQVEFVSANPTGPLHIGHGRGAAVGDTLANILKAAGYNVTKEYYINDAGVQVHTLGESGRRRDLELNGEKIVFPDDYYRGDYVKEIARDFSSMVSRLPGAQAVSTFQEFACEAMLERIKKDLKDFGVEFDVWYSEKEKLRDSGLVESTKEELEKKGFF